MSFSAVLDGTVRFHVEHGDSADRLKSIPDNSIDAGVMDPPYGLSREPDIAEVLRHWLAGDDYVHRGGGFMGKTWDSFVPGPALWREVFRVLKPGAHLLVFGGTRTSDLLTIALRMAGFEIRDSISWLYGSGFPKSLNVSKAIDKAAGAERGRNPNHRAVSGVNYEGTYAGKNTGAAEKTASTTDAAKQWDGWGTSLKPAQEPIIVARKPLIGTVVQNVLAHGTGALNIDACRVVTTDNLNGGAYSGDLRQRDNYAPTDQDAASTLSRLNRGAGDFVQPTGRWPANVVLSHTDECVRLGRKRVKATSIHGEDVAVRRTGAHADAGGHQTIGREQPVRGYADADGKESVEDWQCIAGCPIAELDRQSGVLPPRGNKNVSNSGVGLFHGQKRAMAPREDLRDSGGASRFFNTFESDPDDIATGLFVYQAKASKADRNAGFASDEAGNTHPTLKSTPLMRHLVKLIAKPGDVVLDAFCGSGSTGRGALLEGCRFIGIEREDTEAEPYVTIARRRIADADSKHNESLLTQGKRKRKAQQDLL